MGLFKGVFKRVVGQKRWFWGVSGFLGGVLGDLNSSRGNPKSSLKG